MAAFADNVADSTCTIIVPITTGASNYTSRIRLVVPILFVMPPMPYLGDCLPSIPPWLDPDSRERKRRLMNARTRARWAFIKEPENFYQEICQRSERRIRLPLGVSRKEKHKRYVQGLRRNQNGIHS